MLRHQRRDRMAASRMTRKWKGNENCRIVAQPAGRPQRNRSRQMIAVQRRSGRKQRRAQLAAAKNYPGRGGSLLYTAAPSGRREMWVSHAWRGGLPAGEREQTPLIVGLLEKSGCEIKHGESYCKPIQIRPCCIFNPAHARITKAGYALNVLSYYSAMQARPCKRGLIGRCHLRRSGEIATAPATTQRMIINRPRKRPIIHKTSPIRLSPVFAPSTNIPPNCKHHLRQIIYI